MLISIPAVPFDRESLNEMIECLPSTHQGLQNQITALINSIEASAAIINKNTSLDIQKIDDIRIELKKIRDNAEEFFTLTKYVTSHTSLQNSIRTVILDWIKPCESALSVLADQNSREFKQDIQSLYHQQKNTATTPALKNHLRKIKEHFFQPGKHKTKCYIVHAKPALENQTAEQNVQSFLLELYDHLEQAGIAVKMDLVDLRPGDNYYQFISQYSSGHMIILVGTKSLYDSHYSNAASPMKSVLSSIFQLLDNHAELVYPLLINGTFKSAYPDPFHIIEERISSSQSYSMILKHLIGAVYKNQLINNNTAEYDYLWEQYSFNPDLSNDDEIFEAIKNHTSLSNVATLDNINRKHDLSSLEIDDLKIKLSLRNGKLTDINLTKDLTPLFMAVLYKNRDAYQYLINRGANVRAKAASGTNLLAFMRVFGEKQDCLILEDRYPDLSFEGRNIPVVFEEIKPTAPTVAGVFFQSRHDYLLLTTFIACCKQGDVNGVKLCLQNQTHKRDKEGEGLYEALAAGHEACVKEIIAAGVAVDDRHYFAAGLNRSSGLYYAIKPKEELVTQANNTITHYPQSILDGDVFNMRLVFESSNPDQQTKSAYLYKLLALGHVHAVRFILTTLTVPVAPRHYFAAGLGNDRTTAKMFYKLLTFYTYELVTPNFESSSPYDVLGIKIRREDIPYSAAKQAYRDLATRYHSDKCPNIDDAFMQKLNQAKEQISDKDEHLMNKIARLFSDAENNQYALVMRGQGRAASKPI